MPEAKDFLNPTSMLTPGLAGAITTGIAMPLVVSFDLRYKWVALIIGFMLALLIVMQFKEGISRLERAIYCILNTLIIFSVSVGAGVNMNPPPSPRPLTIDPNIRELIERSQASDSMSNVFEFLRVPSAHAQPAEEGHTENHTRELPTEEGDQRKLTEEEIKRLQEYLQQQEKQKEEQQKYYQRWSW